MSKNTVKFYSAGALLLLTLISLSNCNSTGVETYQNNTPKLELESFFNGQLTAHGIIKNRSGRVIRYFNADIKASWRDGIGSLEEHFLFNDGERSTRIWTLTPQDDGSFIGTAADVVGNGKLNVAGNSLFLDYILQVPYKNNTIELRIDDRMYLTNEKTLINESIMYKFGLKVGAITLVILKQAHNSANQNNQH